MSVSLAAERRQRVCHELSWAGGMRCAGVRADAQGWPDRREEPQAGLSGGLGLHASTQPLPPVASGPGMAGMPGWCMFPVAPPIHRWLQNH